MGQVKIIYDNGIIICVNRHPYNNWTISVGEPGGWFNYHTTDSLDTGILSNNTFTLPAKNGWVVYKPL
jgi:hypothetical protein